MGVARATGLGVRSASGTPVNEAQRNRELEERRRREEQERERAEGEAQRIQQGHAAIEALKEEIMVLVGRKATLEEAQDLIRDSTKHLADAVKSGIFPGEAGQPDKVVALNPEQDAAAVEIIPRE